MSQAEPHFNPQLLRPPGQGAAGSVKVMKRFTADKHEKLASCLQDKNCVCRDQPAGTQVELSLTFLGIFLAGDSNHLNQGQKQAGGDGGAQRGVHVCPSDTGVHTNSQQRLSPVLQHPDGRIKDPQQNGLLDERSVQTASRLPPGPPPLGITLLLLLLRHCCSSGPTSTSGSCVRLERQS